MHAHHAYNIRALVAAALREGGTYSFAAITQILRLRSREDARKLVARGQRLRREMGNRKAEARGDE